MNQIPRNRRIETEIARGGTHEFPVVLFIPTPTGRCVTVDGDDVYSQAEVMCRLPRLRFRGAGIGEEVLLPLRAAISLVEFETGLRLSGFLGMFEVLKQPANNVGKFRVQRSQVPIHFQHFDLLGWLVEQLDRLDAKRGPPAACAAREGGTHVNPEERSVGLRGGEPVRTGSHLMASLSINEGEY